MTDSAGGTRAAAPPQGPKPWWATLTEFLALPAIIVLMFMQFTQGNVNRMTPAQIEAQIAASRAAEVKNRAETQEILDRLQAARTSGSQSEFRASISALQQRLDNLGSASTTLTAGKTVIEVFVLLWIVNMAVGFGLELLQSLWGMLLALVMTSTNAFISRRQESVQDEPWEAADARRRRLSKVRNFLSISFAMASVGVNLLFWTIRVAVFLALFVPFFDLVLKSTGSTATLAWIVDPIRSLDFSAFLDRAQVAILGSR